MSSRPVVYLNMGRYYRRRLIAMVTVPDANANSWYFKETALVDRSKFSSSDTQYHCGWKGEPVPPSPAPCIATPHGHGLTGSGDALYFNYADGSETLKDIAW